jgi:hypothetical protein
LLLYQPRGFFLENLRRQVAVLHRAVVLSRLSPVREVLVLLGVASAAQETVVMPAAT